MKKQATKEKLEENKGFDFSWFLIKFKSGWNQLFAFFSFWRGFQRVILVRKVSHEWKIGVPWGKEGQEGLKREKKLFYFMAKIDELKGSNL